MPAAIYGFCTLSTVARFDALLRTLDNSLTYSFVHTHAPINLMEFTQLKAARVDARHVLHEQCLGNWRDSHFCSHTSTEQKDALWCGTVCHYAAVQDVECSLYNPSFNYVGLITVRQ